MKAYQANTKWGGGSVIVFADTRSQAKLKALHCDEFEDAEYTDIRVTRLPKLDGMENAEPSDNLWLNEEIRTILVRDYNWSCYEPNEYEPCDECCAREYCKEYADLLEHRTGLTFAAGRPYEAWMTEPDGTEWHCEYDYEYGAGFEEED